MRDMIAYCGLDCEKCDAYLATINDRWVLLNLSTNPKRGIVFTDAPNKLPYQSLVRCIVYSYQSIHGLS